MNRKTIFISLTLLMIIAFFIRSYPHLFLIPVWSPEEEYNYQIVNELNLLGKTNQAGLYPIFGHLAIFGIHLLTTIDPVLISQYFNPLFSALTIIPLFLLIKKLSNEQTALITSIFWTFSEAVFYRSSIFSSTETFAFFLITFALLFYTKKQYIPTTIFLALSLYTHLLPAIFAILTILVHQFFIRSTKIKVIIIVSFLSIIAFLLSPLNPHQKIASVLDPAVLFKHFSLSNIFVYSLNDLTFGLTIFAGIIALGIIALITLFKYKKQNNLVFSMLTIAVVLFIFSWIVYSPNLFAPPRLTFYFVIPFSFYVSIFLTKLKVFNLQLPNSFLRSFLLGIILILMLTSSMVGAQTMLFYQNSVTNDEYLALNDLKNIDLFNINPNYWWSDYPIRVSISAIASITYPVSIRTTVNETVVIESSTILADQYATLNPTTHFKYIFFSERMKEEAFFTVFTNNRTVQIREPLCDIWSNSSMWQLIYCNHGVKVYERK